MKILWIEDFDDRLARSALVEEMFCDLFTGIKLDEEYHEEDTDIAGQLTKLFAKYTLHEIYVCKSYVEWTEVDAQHGGDFDIALIDINLGSYTTPNHQRPRGMNSSDFDNNAGFYIYHQLIRRGFPDNNIAFFTAQGQSLKEFSRYCADIFLDGPTHCFQKSAGQFKLLRHWLSEKAAQPSLILRRGVIEGCHFMTEAIGSLDSSELKSRLIFYKTIPGKLNDSPEALRRDSFDYLARLRRLFLVPLDYDDRDFRQQFTKELAGQWDESWGFFLRAKEAPQFREWLENQFHKAAQVQLKTLRNWSNHRQLSFDLTAKELGYFFMLAMRALIETDLNTVFRYEEILSSLFNKISDLELTRQMNSGLELRLEESYEQLKALHAEVLRHVDQSAKERLGPVNHERRMENYFLAILRETGEASKWLKGTSRKYCLSRIRKASIRLFYEGFWHGLFPMEITTTYYANLQRIRFDLRPLPPSFISFLGRSILAECFEKPDVTVSVA